MEPTEIVQFPSASSSAGIAHELNKLCLASKLHPTLVAPINMKTHALVLGIGLFLRTAICLASPVAQQPTAKVVNGTLRGIAIESFHQEGVNKSPIGRIALLTYSHAAFLGIRFAQAPVGDLRLRPARSLNVTFSGVQAADAYSPSVSRTLRLQMLRDSNLGAVPGIRKRRLGLLPRRGLPHSQRHPTCRRHCREQRARCNVDLRWWLF